MKRARSLGPRHQYETLLELFLYSIFPALQSPCFTLFPVRQTCELLNSSIPGSSILATLENLARRLFIDRNRSAEQEMSNYSM